MTSQHLHPANARLALALAATLFASAVAQASEVTFSGGFTSFRGPVATATGARAASVHTEINGVTVYADEALPGAQFGFDRFGLGLKNTFSLRDGAGSPIPSVEFSRIFFSAANPNAVSFTPSAAQDLQAGSIFSVGTFSVTNGSWFGNSASENIYPDTDIGFSVTTHSSDPRLDGFSFSDTLRFVVTAPDSPSATSQQDADYFYFVGHPELGTISVFESTDPQGNPQALGHTGTVDLQVRIGSLNPTALVNASGAAFVGDQASNVPEPGTTGLWLAGLAALGLGVGRQRAGRRG